MGEVSRLEQVKSQPRSVSQVNQYNRCAYAYYLQRIERVWERPAAWLPMGTAVHEAAELYEKSGRSLSLDDAQDAFREAYARDTNRLAAETPNLEYWFASGPYGGEQDIERRYGLGLEQVGRYVDYYEKHADEVIWVGPDGPAIELRFDLDLDGVKMAGYIDQVIEKDGKLVVRDIKTGNQPGDEFQLAVYAHAVEHVSERPVSTGDYWMGRKGKPTKPFTLTVWTLSEVVDAVHQMDEGVKAEEFDPDPEPSKCNFCSVAASCRFRA